jgi:hypothetical protein
MRARLLAVLLCAAAALPVAFPVSARADGDPASDVLIGQDAFYPYAPNTVARELQQALNAMLKQAKARQFELKIALVAATTDLGAVPQLFTQPQKYADLLTSEISFNTKPRVLVVLPSGLGGNNLGDRAGSALAGITPEPAAGADGLARAAMLAVGRLTAANGTPVPVPAVARESGRATGKRDGGTSPLLIFGGPVLLVALAVGVAALRGRGRVDDEDPDGDGDDPEGDGAEPRTWRVPAAGDAGAQPPAQ